MSGKYIILVVIMGCWAMGCRKPYNPPAITNKTNFLVVEGVINSGNDSSRFKLSRTVNLNTVTTAPETGAHVTIEGDNNTSFPLVGNAAGVYTSAPLQLNNSQKYRLHIKTSSGGDYVSDYVAIKTTPPIDTIKYAIKSDGVQLYLDTHDPANNTRYYRWDYTETWEFHSKYFSAYMSTGDTVIERPDSKQIYYCYTSDHSNSILLGSSAKLTKDVISTAPITFVPSTSEKLELKYSILVNQYALTSDAYNFWENLKKNTEELGGIFDPQPSLINGNIHCTNNPSEPVIGYISASTVQSKRIFIDNVVLPITWEATYPFSCSLDSVLLARKINDLYVNEEDAYFNFKKGGGADIPVSAIVEMKVIIGHTGSEPACVDCTVRGTTKQPSFWK